MSDRERLDAVVVGAGFTGLAVLHLLRERGLRVRAYDAAGDVGGTWWWRGFPGSRLDTEGHLHQYFFSEALVRDWGWSERFPAGYEVQRWMRFVADRLELRGDLRPATRVVEVGRDGSRRTVRTDRGETVDAGAVVAATGSRPVEARIADLDAFTGPVLRTASWREDAHDLGGLRVGVVGTTAASVQLVPRIAGGLAHLTVVADRAHDVTPRSNPMFGWRERDAYRARFAELRDAVAAGRDPDPAPRADREEVRAAMRARLGDPRLIALLVPSGEATGPVLLEDGYLEALRHAEVAGPGTRACPEGLVLDDGTVRELDVLVVADEVGTGPPAWDLGTAPTDAATTPPPGAVPCLHLYREAVRIAATLTPG